MGEQSEREMSGSVQEPESAAVCENNRRSTVAELTRFDDGSGRARYRARTEDGNQYLLDEPLAEILRLSDGVRTGEKIAGILSERHGVPVTADQVEQAIVRHLLPRALVETAAPCAGPKPPAPKQKRLQFGTDFVLRIGLLSEARVWPLVKPLRRLFSPRSAVPADSGRARACSILLAALSASFRVAFRRVHRLSDRDCQRVLS